MINLTILTDNRLYGEGLEGMLGRYGSINVLGVLENVKQLVKCSRINPLDVVLFDMRIDNACEMLTSIARDCSNVKVVVLGVVEASDDYLSCMESVVSGCLLKGASIEDLVTAVTSVADGDLYCPGVIARSMLKSVRNKNKGNQKNDFNHKYLEFNKLLTRREIQIIKLIADGMSNKLIAKTLAIELSTVKNHIHNILVKMEVKNRAQAASVLQEYYLMHEDKLSDVNSYAGFPGYMS